MGAAVPQEHADRLELGAECCKVQQTLLCFTSVVTNTVRPVLNIVLSQTALSRGIGEVTGGKSEERDEANQSALAGFKLSFMF